MHKAAGQDDVDKLEKLKGNVNEANKKGDSVLHAAVQGDASEATAWLVARGANCEARDKQGDPGRRTRHSFHF